MKISLIGKKISRQHQNVSDQRNNYQVCLFFFLGILVKTTGEIDHKNVFIEITLIKNVLNFCIFIIFLIKIGSLNVFENHKNTIQEMDDDVKLFRFRIFSV